MGKVLPLEYSIQYTPTEPYQDHPGAPIGHPYWTKKIPRIFSHYTMGAPIGRTEMGDNFEKPVTKITPYMHCSLMVF